tara:strand:- start:104 stop:394 length:291 start_codon:yes stop_codon:yes gene_type:complete
MAAGDDSLILYTLPGGNQVFLNVNHIVSIEELTKKTMRQSKHPDLNIITMSSGKVYETIQATSGLLRTGSNATFASSSIDIKATVAKGGVITGGRF